MSDFPPIGDELRPKAKLKRHTNETATDAEIEENSRRIGERWGAATRIKQEPEHVPLAPVVSIRGYIPEYLDQEMAMKAAERRVTRAIPRRRVVASAHRRAPTECRAPRPQR